MSQSLYMPHLPIKPNPCPLLSRFTPPTPLSPSLLLPPFFFSLLALPFYGGSPQHSLALLNLTSLSPSLLPPTWLIPPPTGREMEAYRKDGKINSIQSSDYILAPPPPLHPFHCKPCATTTTTGITITSSTAGMAADTATHMQAFDSLKTAPGDPFREVTNSVGSSGAVATAATVTTIATAPPSNMVAQLPSNTALLDFLSGSGSGADGLEACEEEAQPGLLYRASIPCGNDQSTTPFGSLSDTFGSTQTNRGSSFCSSGDIQGVTRAGGLCGESSRRGREGGKRTGLFDKLTDENVYGIAAADGGGSGSGGAGVSGVSRRASRCGKNETERKDSRSESRSESRSGSVHRHSSASSRSSEGGSERASLYSHHHHHRHSTQGGGSGGKGRRAETGSEGGEAREREKDKEKEKGRRAGLWSARGLVKVLTRGSMDLGLVVDEEDLMEEGDARRELEGVVQR
ncbi:unnamed protein product [Closterium sp. NIES-53]